MDTNESRNGFPRVLCAAMTLMAMVLALACFGAKGEEGSVKGKTDNSLGGIADPSVRHPIGKGDWEFDANGNVKIKLQGYKKGDVLWLNKDGMDIMYTETQNGASFTYYEEGTLNRLDGALSGQLDPNTGQPEFKDAKDAFEKMLEKAKKALKKIKKAEKKRKDNGIKTSNDGPSIPVTLDMGIFMNGGDCHRRDGCHREPCRRESRGIMGFRF